MPNMVCRCSEGKKEGSGRLWLRPSRLLLPVSRYCATRNAVRCGDGCSALRWPTQRAAFSIPRQGSTAGRLPLHPSLRLPAASSSLRKSPVSLFVSCGPVPSAALGCASCCAGLSFSLVRFCAFCCVVLCPLLCGSVHSFARTDGVAGVGCRSGNDVGMGL